MGEGGNDVIPTQPYHASAPAHSVRFSLDDLDVTAPAHAFFVGELARRRAAHPVAPWRWDAVAEFAATPTRATLRATLVGTDFPQWFVYDRSPELVRRGRAGPLATLPCLTTLVGSGGGRPPSHRAHRSSGGSTSTVFHEAKGVHDRAGRSARVQATRIGRTERKKGGKRTGGRALMAVGPLSFLGENCSLLAEDPGRLGVRGLYLLTARLSRSTTTFLSSSFWNLGSWMASATRARSASRTFCCSSWRFWASSWAM